MSEQLAKTTLDKFHVSITRSVAREKLLGTVQRSIWIATEYVVNSLMRGRRDGRASSQSRRVPDAQLLNVVKLVASEG